MVGSRKGEILDFPGKDPAVIHRTIQLHAPAPVVANKHLQLNPEMTVTMLDGCQILKWFNLQSYLFADFPPAGLSGLLTGTYFTTRELPQSTQESFRPPSGN